MNKQLEDHGAVIGYQPILEYNKEHNAQGKVDSKTNQTTDKTLYSKTLQGFINNVPSVATKDLLYASNSIQGLIDKLAQSFQGNWNEYNNINMLLTALEIGNNEYAIKFIDYHQNLITGSIIPELISELNSIKTRVDTLSETLKELYYGNAKLSQEEVEDIDKAYIQQLTKLDKEKALGVPNYIALSCDATLNRSVTMYAYNVNKRAIGLSKVVLSKTNITDDNTKTSLLNQLYQEANKNLEHRRNAYEMQQNVEIMQKTLYNYYEKRSIFLNMYEMYNNNPEFPLMERMYDYQEQLNKSIENVARTFAGNQYHITELTHSEQEKYDLMQNYSKLSYKS